MAGPPLTASMGYHPQPYGQPVVSFAPRSGGTGSGYGPSVADDDGWYRGYGRAPLPPPQAGSAGAGWDQNKRIWEAACVPSRAEPAARLAACELTPAPLLAPPPPRSNTAPPLIYSQNQFPSLGVSSNASSSRTTSPNPSAGPGGGAKITLLKRPTATPAAGTGSGTSSGRNTPPTKTLSQREEEYRLARERIFAGSAGSGGGGCGGPSGAGGGPAAGGGGRLGSNGGGGGGSGGGHGSRRTPPGSSSGNHAGGGPDAGGGGIARQPHGPSRDGSGGFGARSGSGRGRVRN